VKLPCSTISVKVCSRSGSGEFSMVDINYFDGRAENILA
jgi:hypothetical protein